MAIRTITFEATLDGISPKAPQNAGIQGEHNATTVVINLSTQLITELNKPNTYYRFEFVDCMGQFDTTENFTLSSGAIGVNIDIPNGWTSSGGNAELRLVIVRLNVDNNEEMILYSLPCKLKFEGRDTGTGLTPETVEKGLSGLIADAKTATESANSAASSAINAAITVSMAGDYAKEKGDYAELQGNYAKAKGDYADEHGAAARVATDLANTAATAANAAANSANTAANNANQAAGNANAAADAANAAADAAVAVGKKTPEGGEIFNSYTGSDANRATAPYSHAEGIETTASGYASHAEGSGTTASGPCSHAEGSGTTASGDYSHAGGYGTIASAEAQTAIGKYNAEDTNALFIVGNGTFSSRSNAFTVKLDGSATVQTQGTSNNSVIIKSTLDTALAGKQSTSITDAGGYFTADTVEGALQEIGAQLSGKETPAGAQAKADIAEANAKAYTDAHEQKAAPHSGHETPAGAQAKADAAAAAGVAAANAVQANLDAHKADKAAHFNVNYTHITDGDLNDYRLTTIRQVGDATNVANMPPGETGWGLFVVLNKGDGYTSTPQFYITFENFYFRCGWDDWSPWRKIATSDVESGTFTPTIIGLTTAGNNTYSANYGFYEKIGRTVIFHIYIEMTAKDPAMEGGVYIAGLPFVAYSQAARHNSVSIASYSYIVTAGKQLGGYIQDNSATVGLLLSGDNTDNHRLTASGINNNTLIRLSGIYQTA